MRPQLPRQSQHQRWRIQWRRPLRTCAAGGATGVVGVDALGTASSGSRATTHGSEHRRWWGWMMLKDFYVVFFFKTDVKYNQSIFYTHHILIVITTPPPPPPPRTLRADPKHCNLQCFCAFGMDKVLLATCWELRKYQCFRLARAKKHCKYHDVCHQRQENIVNTVFFWASEAQKT